MPDETVGHLNRPVIVEIGVGATLQRGPNHPMMASSILGDFTDFLRGLIFSGAVVLPNRRACQVFRASISLGSDFLWGGATAAADRPGKSYSEFNIY